MATFSKPEVRVQSLVSKDGVNGLPRASKPPRVLSVSVRFFAPVATSPLIPAQLRDEHLSSLLAGITPQPASSWVSSTGGSGPGASGTVPPQRGDRPLESYFMSMRRQSVQTRSPASAGWEEVAFHPGGNGTTSWASEPSAHGSTRIGPTLTQFRAGDS